jgi:hypothetical protein
MREITPALLLAQLDETRNRDAAARLTRLLRGRR